MVIVIDFDIGIDAAAQGDFLTGLVGFANHQYDGFLWLEIAEAKQVEVLVASEAKRLHAVIFHELQWQHAHADEVTAVDTFVTLCNNGAYPQ